jgi:O-antigen ligase
MTNSISPVEPARRENRISLRIIAAFSFLVVLGALAALYPMIWLGVLAAAVALRVCWWLFARFRRQGLELWQMMLLVAVSGYLLLNYGFENIAVHVGGLPVIISYGLVYGALLLAFFANRHLMRVALREPAIMCAIALLVLALIHLVIDLPTYGVWAIRDSTMCLDSLVMIMGVAWAAKKDSLTFVTRWMLALFILNALYCFTMPWTERIWGWSPESGVFLQVPIFGNFNGVGDLLVAGAMFCICFGSYLVKRPSWLMPLLAVVQLLGVAIVQVRRMYIGIVILLLMLVFLGEAKKFVKLLALVPTALAIVVLATSVGGLHITGRIGEINLQFFEDHLRSISGAEDTPGSDPESRVIMADQAMTHFYAHPLFGEGFGQPLTDIIEESGGAVTRMPHDSSITYLARLGIVGILFWIAFHFCLLRRFIDAYRQRRTCDKRVYAFVLWLFLFYVICMISSFVEAEFEYPRSAVPFYFFIGFGLGLIRWHLTEKSGNAAFAALPASGFDASAANRFSQRP